MGAVVGNSICTVFERYVAMLISVKLSEKVIHRQYKHPTKPGRVTVPGKLADDMAPGTFSSILKQFGLKIERYL